MKYSDQQRLRKIYDYATKLSAYIEDNHISKEMVMSDEAIQWLVTTPLYNIGEHVYGLTDEYKEAHKEIQWAMISGLRHRLIHDYDGTNWSIIVEVLFDDIPVFVKQLEELVFPG